MNAKLLSACCCYASDPSLPSPLPRQSHGFRTNKKSQGKAVSEIFV